MDALSKLLSLPESESSARGLVHTAAEIAQQPDTWLGTFQLFQQRQAEIREFLSSVGLSAECENKPTVFLVGAGTSDYIGQSLTFLLRRAWKCEVLAVPSTDLLTHRDALMIPGQRYLWISFSRSGDSPEGVAVLDGARDLDNIHHLIVSCNSEGRMLREAAGHRQMLGVCLDDAVNDRGLAMTSSFSNMVVFGQCLAHLNDPATYVRVLQQLVNAGRHLLPLASDCAEILARDKYAKACFIGSGALRAVARESALKLLELTAGKILTTSESALGLRHGPMAALDQQTLLVCFLSGEQRVRQYELDLLAEIGHKRLVRTRAVVSAEALQASKLYAELVMAHAPSSEIMDEYRPPLDVIFGQLLGLFCSLQLNLRPDCPSPNGAISRVVQNVSIHS